MCATAAGELESLENGHALADSFLVNAGRPPSRPSTSSAAADIPEELGVEEFAMALSRLEWAVRQSSYYSCTGPFEDNR